MKKWIFLVVLLIVRAADLAADEIPSFKLLHVSDGFTLNEKPAVSIYFGESDNNFCNFTLVKSTIKKDAVIISIKGNNADFSAECNWDNGYFVDTSKFDTNAGFKLTNRKADGKQVIVVKASLFDPQTKKFFSFDFHQVETKKSSIDLLKQ